MHLCCVRSGDTKWRREEDAAEEESPCSACAALGPATQLECGSCRAAIPYCIATGHARKRCAHVLHLSPNRGTTIVISSSCGWMNELIVSWFL